MPATRRSNSGVLLLVISLLVMMGGLTAFAPTLYQMFCDLTGYGGTVQQTTVDPAAAPAAAVGEEVTVRFDANVDPGLPWKFEAEQQRVTTHPGEPTKVYYRATNTSDRTIVARAAFNVTPYKAAKYFFKIECFCFTEEKLGPGESARMPLVLYVDQQMLKDPNTDEVRDVTLSYTFYEQKNLSEKEIAEARDLKAESKALDSQLDDAPSVEFENDAPRR